MCERCPDRRDDKNTCQININNLLSPKQEIKNENKRSRNVSRWLSRVYLRCGVYTLICTQKMRCSGFGARGPSRREPRETLGSPALHPDDPGARSRARAARAGFCSSRFEERRDERNGMGDGRERYTNKIYPDRGLDYYLISGGYGQRVHKTLNVQTTLITVLYRLEI